MVNIRAARMRTATAARNAFNELLGDAERGIMTHITKDGRVVAHLVPSNAPILDDRSLRHALIAALTARDAAEVGAYEWREERLWHAGDSIGRLLAWTWSSDSDLCLQAFAMFHDNLQKVVGSTIGLDAIWPGIEVALRIALGDSEIAELCLYLEHHYDDYYLGPHRDTGSA